jgi:hypothetical protein
LCVADSKSLAKKRKRVDSKARPLNGMSIKP